MTETNPQPTITFTLDTIGEITMIGTGPWRTYEVGHSREIKDSAGQIANPTVVQRFSTTTKPNRNVIFAQPSKAQAIVDKANELLAAATA